MCKKSRTIRLVIDLRFTVINADIFAWIIFIKLYGILTLLSQLQQSLVVAKTLQLPCYVYLEEYENRCGVYALFLGIIDFNFRSFVFASLPATCLATKMKVDWYNLVYNKIETQLSVVVESNTYNF